MRSSASLDLLVNFLVDCHLPRLRMHLLYRFDSEILQRLNVEAVRMPVRLDLRRRVRTRLCHAESAPSVQFICPVCTLVHHALCWFWHWRCYFVKVGAAAHTRRTAFCDPQHASSQTSPGGPQCAHRGLRQPRAGRPSPENGRKMQRRIADSLVA